MTPKPDPQKLLYPTQYTSSVSTRVSNALLVGEIIGQVVVGLVCDRIGRKTAMVGTTLLIVIGGILATAAKGTSKLSDWITIHILTRSPSRDVLDAVSD